MVLHNTLMDVNTVVLHLCLALSDWSSPTPSFSKQATAQPTQLITDSRDRGTSRRGSLRLPQIVLEPQHNAQ